MTEQRFWQRWLQKKTKESLVAWLERQGVFMSMGITDYRNDKYSLNELQRMVFEEDYAFFWVILKKEQTKLPVDISLDELGCCRKGNILSFPPLILFQNNYERKIMDVLPMSIEQNPKILEDEKYIKIKREDVELIKQFIIHHYDLLIKHWNTSDAYKLYEITKELHKTLKNNCKVETDK